MQLPIENWVVESALDRPAAIAFNESAICFKAGAYRASLLFAYLGWSLTIRLRILAASCPTGMKPGQWTNIQNSLKKEDEWDSQTFDCTQMQAPKAIFDVSDDIRLQVRFWKDRRNDCAHFKDNAIDSAHVEALWLFVQSNLPKFVPNGSYEDTLARIARHFDPNVTPPGTSVDPVVRRIPAAIATPDLPRFLTDVVTRLSGKIGSAFTYVHWDHVGEVYAAMFRLNDVNLNLALQQSVSANPKLLVNVLRRQPNLVLALAGNAQLIRQLWRALLFTDSGTDLPIYAALLRNGLIPQPEIAEANRRVALSLNGDIPTPTDLPTLTAEGFLTVLRDLVFGSDTKINEFNWGNRNARTIQWLVASAPITDQEADTMCSVFVASTYPFKVQEALHELFAADPAKRAELQVAAQRLSRTVPATLI